MAKILIAPIGTGGYDKNNTSHTREYKSATYQLDEKLYKTSFISSALIQHYGIEKVFYIGTGKSMWEEVYRVHCELAERTLNDEYYLNLIDTTEKNNSFSDPSSFNTEELENMLGANYKVFIINYGKNEIELLFNFEILMGIADQLNDGDEIYIDITHSFRSISLYMFVIMNYLSDIASKNIIIKNISYGMFELKDENNGIAPVVNLQSIYELMKWIKGAYDFQNNGNAYLISEMIEENDKDVSNKLKNFSDILNINSLSSLKIHINSLNNIKEKIMKIEGPARKIVPEVIGNFVNKFINIKNDAVFQVELARWYYDHKKYSSAFIVLHESILTFLCISEELDSNSKEDRDLMKEFLRKYKNDKILKVNSDLVKIDKKYKTITNVRNNIAHSIGEREMAFKQDIINLLSYIEDLSLFYVNRKTSFIENKNKKEYIIRICNAKRK